MKQIGRTLAILAAALVVVGFAMAVAALSGSSAGTAADLSGHALGGQGMQSGFNLGGIAQILPALAVVAIVTAIVAPIKRRLPAKGRPSAAARGAKVATPAA